MFEIAISQGQGTRTVLAIYFPILDVLFVRPPSRRSYNPLTPARPTAGRNDTHGAQVPGGHPPRCRPTRAREETQNRQRREERKRE